MFHLFPLGRNECKDMEEVKPKYLEIQADWTAMHHGAAVMRASSGWLLGSSPRELLKFKWTCLKIVLQVYKMNLSSLLEVTGKSFLKKVKKLGNIMCHLFISEICSVDDYCNLITCGLHKIIIVIITTYLTRVNLSA